MLKFDLITIVVPIYNVEEYLKECVESLISQKYVNIEILLIDDGSTDNSGKIAEKIAEKDSRIKVFHKENGGLSDARNFGIKKAKGKYICFVDSDDYVTEDYVSTMYDNLKQNNTQISACGFCHLYENGIKKEINFQGIKKKFDNDDAQKYLNIIGYYNISSCNKLFDIELFNDIEFPFGMKSEDWYVMYKIIEKSKSLYYDSDSKYIYRQRMGSITKNSKANIHSISAAEEVYNYFKNNKNVSKYAAQSLAFAVIGVYNFQLCKGNKKRELLEYYQKVKKIQKELTYKELPFSRKVQLFMFLKMNYIYDIIFKIFSYRRMKNNGK